MTPSSREVVSLATAVALIWLIPLGLTARRYLHILQLEEYSNRRFVRWASANQSHSRRVSRWAALALALATVFSAMFAARSLTALLLLVWLLPAAAIMATLRAQPAKKPLVYTARIRRLVAAMALAVAGLTAIAAALLHLAAAAGNPYASAAIAPILPVALLLAADFRALVAANLLAQPAEAAVRLHYVKDARRRIRRLAPKVIAITGSYGKTTTKEILGAILSTRFSTVKTPESWNTLMGVTRAIRERLAAEHEIFIVEMGAYQRGEIAELCDLTGPPSVGILTGINEQHLERFGGIQNTIKAKYELIEAVQPGGLAVFNVDNAYCRELADRTNHARVVRVGLAAEQARLDYTATDVTVSAEGTRFTVVTGNASMQFRTRLLGEHFILNVLAATAAAVECGVTLRQAAAAVAAMPPVAHRLQLVPGSAGITTIDDAYSANPDGARAALRVLGQMRGGKRILVTPGFVELGDRESDLNRSLGELAASACDILVLVGPRHTLPIREGAMAAGMDAASIEVVESVASARDYLQGIARRGDTILFENDLPDNYDE